jgi:hypothetical protein
VKRKKRFDKFCGLITHFFEKKNDHLVKLTIYQDSRGGTFQFIYARYYDKWMREKVNNQKKLNEFSKLLRNYHVTLLI